MWALFNGEETKQRLEHTLFWLGCTLLTRKRKSWYLLLAGLTGLHGNVAAADEEFAGHMERKKRQILREWSRACVLHMLAICSNNKEKTGEHTCIHALIKHMQFTHTQTHSSALITFELISFSSQREENESLPHPCWGTKSRGLVGLG